MTQRSARFLPWLAAAALGAGCSGTAEDPLEGGRPLTPQEMEYQRKLALSEQVALDATGRSKLILSLDRSLQHWHRSTVEQVGTEEKQLTDSFEEVLQVTVYMNFDEILDVLESGAPNQRGIAAAALGFSRLKEPEDPAQRERFLARWPRLYPRAIDPLVRHLGAEEPYVVQNCLLALWKLGDASTPVGPLLELLASPDPSIRANAALALSTVLTPETGETAIAALLNALYDDDPKVRNHAATAVGAIRHKGAAGRLAQMLDDHYLLVQANAARALGQLGDRGNCGVLIARLERLQAEMPDSKFREKTDLDDRRRFVQAHLIDALQRLSGKYFGGEIEKWREWWSEKSESAP